MLTRKEKLFQQYYNLSLEALNSLDGEDAELVDVWLAKREEISTKIDSFDREQGVILLNDSIKNQIDRIIEIDNQLKNKMLQLKTEAADQLREIRAAKQLHNTYYDEDVETAEGIFYDKRK